MPNCLASAYTDRLENFYFFGYHKVLLEVYFMDAHTQKITAKIFFWIFRIVPATKSLFLCFYRLAKPTTFALAVMTTFLFVRKFFRSLYFFLGSISKGFGVLKSDKSFSALQLSEEVLECLSAILKMLFLIFDKK